MSFKLFNSRTQKLLERTLTGLFILGQLIFPFMATQPVIAADPGVVSTPLSDSNVTPYIIDGANNGGNRTCAEVGIAFFADANYYESSSERFDDGDQFGGTAGPITWSTVDDTYVTWGGSTDSLAIIVKGSSDANVYVYDATFSTLLTSDSSLASPIAGGSNSPAALSNITFCYTEKDTTTSDEANLTLIKNVVGVGGTATAGDFTPTVNGLTTIQNQTVSWDTKLTLTPGTYAVDEETPLVSGYSQTDLTCYPTGDSTTKVNEPVELAAGDDVTCEITNTFSQPDPDTTTVEVVKILAPASDDGLFDLWVEGQVRVQDVGHNGTTGKIVIDPNDDISLKEYAGTNTQLSNYTTSIICRDDGGQGNVIDSYNPYGATFRGLVIENDKINAGDDIVCEITNTRLSGTITLNKVVNNDNGGTAGVNDFGLSIGAEDVNSGETLTLSPGSYAINEVGLAGYKFVSITGEDCPAALGDNVVLKNGDNITCTITNTALAPTLTVIKKVINDNGGTATVGNFGLKIGSDNLNFDDGVTTDYTTTYTASPSIRANTDYTLSEQDYFGYTEGTWSCSDQSPASGLVVTVNLGLAEDVTCTIVNDDQAPKLVLKKILHDDFNSDLTVDAWTLTATGPTNLSGTTGVTSGAGFVAGDYTLSESGPDTPGVLSGDWVCTGNNGQVGALLSINVGDDVECTVTNTTVAPKLTLKKIVDNSNGNDHVPSDWILSAAPSQGSPITGNGQDGFEDVEVQANLTYTLSELGPSGYEPSDWNCKSVYENDFTQPDGDNSISLQIGANVTCEITNTSGFGDVKVRKFNDSDTDGELDEFEPLLTGWTIRLYDTDWKLVDELVTSGSEWDKFENLPLGKYYICEVEQSGWLQTRPNSPDGVENDSGASDEYNRCFVDNLTKHGAEFSCEFGNFTDEPKLLIEKTNDAADALLPGAQVIYTIRVTNPNDSASVFDAEVGDVLPAGFSFTGTFQMISDVRGDITAFASPSYNSDNFGTWQLGDLVPGEVVHIFYLVKIGGSVPAGTYENVAYVEACPYSLEWQDNDRFEARISILSDDDYFTPSCEGTIFGQDESPDGPDDIFAESAVTIGQVLGEFKPPVLAVTGVPIAASVTGGGIIALLSGLLSLSRERRRALKKLLGKLNKLSRAAVLVTIFSVMSVIPALAGQWTLRAADLADTYQTHNLAVEYKVATTQQTDQFKVDLDVNGPVDSTQTASFSGSRADAFTVEFDRDGVYQVSIVASNITEGNSQSSSTQTITIDTGEQVEAEAQAAARRAAQAGSAASGLSDDGAGVVSDAAATDSNEATDTDGQEQGATDNQNNDDQNSDEDSNILPTILTIAAVALIGYYFLNRRPAE